MRPEIRSILLPIDISDASSRVAGYAAALAERFNARLTALYVVEESEGLLGFTVASRDTDESVRELEDAAMKELAEHAHRYLPAGTEVRVEAGDPTHKILEAAEQVGADLIVMGNHNRKGLERLLVGSTAEHVIRESKVPVVSVPLLAA